MFDAIWLFSTFYVLLVGMMCMYFPNGSFYYRYSVRIDTIVYEVIIRLEKSKHSIEVYHD